MKIVRKGEKTKPLVQKSNLKIKSKNKVSPYLKESYIYFQCVLQHRCSDFLLLLIIV